VRISEIISRSEQPVFSFEFFPPRSEEGEHNLRQAIEKLTPLEPSFVSITRRGGSATARTVEVTRWMKQELGLEAMAHLTGYGSTAEELRGILDCIAEAGIENVLALRGDPPQEQPGWSPENEPIQHASDLIELIARDYSFCVGAPATPSCTWSRAISTATSARSRPRPMPEPASSSPSSSSTMTSTSGSSKPCGQPGSSSRSSRPDADHERRADQAHDRALGATMPSELIAQIELRANDSDTVLELGVAHAALQAADLLARGAPGIHFYTLNRSPSTRAILSALKISRPWERRG